MTLSIFYSIIYPVKAIVWQIVCLLNIWRIIMSEMIFPLLLKWVETSSVISENHASFSIKNHYSPIMSYTAMIMNADVKISIF